MNWCCHPFRNSAENDVGDGFVVYAMPPRSPDGEPRFGFAFRAMRADNIPLLQAVSGGGPPGNIKLTGTSHIHFCPWCGVRLAEHYQTSYKEFADEKVSGEFEFV
jgi:hypothetical protein